MADSIVCVSGTDGREIFSYVNLIGRNEAAGEIRIVPYPTLLGLCAFGYATIVDDVIDLAGDQSDPNLDMAMINFWSLDLSQKNRSDGFRWQSLTPWPRTSRALYITVQQPNGYNDCVCGLSGRRINSAGKVQFPKDVWDYAPVNGQWRLRSDVPRRVMAGLSASVNSGRTAGKFR